MEFTKGTLVRCKLTHQFLKVEEFTPAHTVKRYGQEEQRPARLWLKQSPKDRGVLRMPDQVVRLA